MSDRTVNAAGMARLTNDLLVECAAELNAKTQEVEDLKFDNALLTVQLRILELRLAKLAAISSEKKGIA